MSGCARVLDRLADGDWHSSYELTHDLEVMTHSRIADLRREGHVIEKRRVAGETGLRAYEYRLLSDVAQLVERRASDPAVVVGDPVEARLAPERQRNGATMAGEVNGRPSAGEDSAGEDRRSGFESRRRYTSDGIVALLEREGFAEAEEQLALV